MFFIVKSQCELSNPDCLWAVSVEMVTSMEITKVGVRDRVTIDLKVGMENPDDHEFQPRAHLDGNIVRITNEGRAGAFTSVELDDDVLNACERDRFVELRVKFEVGGMHGVLNHANPNPRDGKGKKLANPSWKTVVPLL